MTEEIISMEEYVAEEKMQLMTNFIRSFVGIADSQNKSIHGYGPNYEKVVLRLVTIQIEQEGIENLRKLIEEI